MNQTILNKVVDAFGTVFSHVAQECSIPAMDIRILITYDATEGNSYFVYRRNADGKTRDPYMIDVQVTDENGTETKREIKRIRLKKCFKNVVMAMSYPLIIQQVMGQNAVKFAQEYGGAPEDYGIMLSCGIKADESGKAIFDPAGLPRGVLSRKNKKTGEFVDFMKLELSDFMSL